MKFAKYALSALMLGAVTVSLMGGLSAEARHRRGHQCESLTPSAQSVINSGYMSYYGDGKFHGERGITRAELATVLAKAFNIQNLSLPTWGNANVDDLNNHWATNSMESNLKVNAMTGFREGKFYPERRLSRMDGYTIIGQVVGTQKYTPGQLESVLKAYPDSVMLPDYARSPIATLLEQGVVDLHVDKSNTNLLEPHALITRNEVADVLAKYLEQGKLQRRVN